MELLGLDIGGSGIKAAIVNSHTGELLSERYRIATPKPATPKLIAEVVESIVNEFEWQGPVGCSFPSIIIDGQCLSAGNISPKWIGVHVDELFSKQCKGLPFYVGNDADLAGFAEITLGAGKNREGTVILITIGTGIGSAFFYNGALIPNFELGHLFHTDGRIMELFASDATRKREDLRLREWAERFDFYLSHLERLFSPNYFILGGGISKKFHRFKDYLSIDTPIEVAHFKNNAGIIGAAMFAHQYVQKA